MVDIGLGKTAGCCCLKSSSNGLTLLLLLLKLLEEKKGWKMLAKAPHSYRQTFPTKRRSSLHAPYDQHLRMLRRTKNQKHHQHLTFFCWKKFQFLAGKNSLDTKLFFFFIWSHWSGFLHWTSEMNRKKIWKMRRIFIRFLFRSGKNLF